MIAPFSGISEFVCMNPEAASSSAQIPTRTTPSPQLRHALPEYAPPLPNSRQGLSRHFTQFNCLISQIGGISCSVHFAVTVMAQGPLSRARFPPGQIYTPSFLELLTAPAAETVHSLSKGTSINDIRKIFRIF